MENSIKELLNGKLDELGLFVDSVTLSRENNNLFLRICLDGECLNLDNIVKATKIINPIMDLHEDLIDEKYVLEVYGKSKGDNHEKE